MPLGTLDRTAPPLFNQGPSALSKLIFFSTLALFLMVADARFNIVQPVRLAIGTVLYPVQWLALKPVQMVAGGERYFEDLKTAQENESSARRSLALQSERASQADALALDNARLRALLELRQTTQTPGRAAEVLYDTSDPYTRKVVIDQGLNNGIAAGSPVIDEFGVLGQVTQVQPFTSEITLVIDRDLAIPVQNMRTGARSVAFGDASAHGGRPRTALHAGQRRCAGRRPAHHQRGRRRLSAGPAGGEDRQHRAARRHRLRPHPLRAAGPCDRRALRAGAGADRQPGDAACGVVRRRGADAPASAAAKKMAERQDAKAEKADAKADAKAQAKADAKAGSRGQGGREAGDKAGADKAPPLPTRRRTASPQPPTRPRRSRPPRPRPPRQPAKPAEAAARQEGAAP